ncbi:hypothetical protein SALBM135S_05198 [Streptomyces alboniger]
MDGRDLVRSVKVLGMVGTAQGLRTVRSSWRRRRVDAAGLSRRGAERARVPGPVTGVEPGPGGGVVRFARSELRVRVTTGGAVFWGWDGADPEPSYALACGSPECRSAARAGTVLPVRGDGDGIELEAWAPVRGGTGGGLVVADAGEGWEEGELERYTTRWSAGRVLVEREGSEGAMPAGRPVRVRGLGD